MSSFKTGSDRGYGSGSLYQQQSFVNDDFSPIFKKIEQLRNEFQTISQLSLNIGKPKDNQKFRTELEGQMASTTKLFRETQNSIKGLSVPSASAYGKEKKQKVDKLSQDFEKFHTKYKELVRYTQNKLEEYPLPTTKQRYSDYEQVPLHSDMYSNDPAQEEEALLRAHRQQLQHQLTDDINFQDSLIHEREKEIEIVQGQMIQVNEIFQDLSRLVGDQGEMLDTIQSHIVDASANVETAVEEIKQASKSQQSSRKYLCFLAIFFTVVVAVGIIILVLVVGKKK